jgi:hypothetical protein
LIVFSAGRKRYETLERASGQMVGISGQSLPILAPLPTVDVLWSDLHMVHKDRSLMSYESFYWTFRTARTQKILAGSGDLPHETKIRLEKNNTSQKNLF